MSAGEFGGTEPKLLLQKMSTLTTREAAKNETGAINVTRKQY